MFQHNPTISKAAINAVIDRSNVSFSDSPNYRAGYMMAMIQNAVAQMDEKDLQKFFPLLYTELYTGIVP